MSSLGFPAQEPGRGARSVAGRAEEDVGATEPALTGPSDNEAALWDAVGVALAAVRLFVAWHVGVVSAERAMGLLGESVTTRGAGTSFGRTEETAAAKPTGGGRDTWPRRNPKARPVVMGTVLEPGSDDADDAQASLSPPLGKKGGSRERASS